MRPSKLFFQLRHRSFYFFKLSAKNCNRATPGVGGFAGGTPSLLLGFSKACPASAIHFHFRFVFTQPSFIEVCEFVDIVGRDAAILTAE